METHKRRMRLLAVTGVAALVAGTVLAGCSSSSKTGTSANGSNTATASTNQSAPPATGGSTGSSAATPTEALPVTISLIGPPPLHASLWADVATEQGYFKDVGLTPTWRYFGHGADVVKTLVAKSVDVAGMGPTTANLQLQSQGSPIVLVAGMDNQDWLVGVSDPNVKTCQDLKGQTIADDGPNNARRIFLGVLLKSCGLTLDDTKHVAIGSTPADLIKASINGQVKATVLHAPELAQVQAGAKVTTWHGISPPASVISQAHYEAFSVLKPYLETDQGKTITTRVLAAYILARAWIMDPANFDAFATLTSKAQATTDEVAKAGNKMLIDEVKFWQPGLGLTKANLEGQINLMVDTGTIDKTKVPTYDSLVDASIYPQALELAKKFNAKVE